MAERTCSGVTDLGIRLRLLHGRCGLRRRQPERGEGTRQPIKVSRSESAWRVSAAMSLLTPEPFVRGPGD